MRLIALPEGSANQPNASAMTRGTRSLRQSLPQLFVAGDDEIIELDELASKSGLASTRPFNSSRCQ